jgi:radical SAM superfamily enzyme YgiQ (UPF0313 family)
MVHSLSFIGKKATLPPLGLLTVAAMLPEDCEVTLVDMNVERLTDDHIRAADLVFTSSMLIQKQSHEEVVRQCKRLGKPILAGGPYPTSSQDQIEGVDHFVLGEAEDVLPRFLADYRAGHAARTYEAAERPALSRTPVPRFELLQAGVYANMAVQFSRGCPHSCEFCDVVELFGHMPRTKPPQQLLAELNAVYATGFRGGLFIVDDNFIGNRRDVMRLLPLVAEWQKSHGYPFLLFTEATVSVASDEALMDAMVLAGFNAVFLGIETPVQECLRDAHKLQNTKLDLLASVHRLQHKGLEVMAGFIVGFDGDPDDVFDRQVEFIEAAGIPVAMVGILTALPRTKLHARLAAEGRLVHASTGNNTHDLELTFTPRMSAPRLIAGYQQLLTKLYQPRRYFERCITFLRSLRVHRNSSRTVRLTELRALFLSLLRQGFSRYALTYWRYLWRAFWISPRMFPEAVTMAVKGHHFFTITEAIVPGLGRRVPHTRAA